MRNFTLLFLFFTSTTYSLTAQTRANKSNAFFFDLGFDIGIPMHEFKTYNEEVGVGGGFGFFYQPSVKIPILIGADFAFMNNGYREETETLYVEIMAGQQVLETIVIPMRVQMSNTVNTGHLDLRFLSPTKFFKPYLDAFVGFNHFSTNTSIYDESEEYYLSEEDNPLITRANQNSDWTYNYGGAAGLVVELSENFLINIRVAYQLGGEAEYFVEDDIEDWDIQFTSVPTSQDDISEDDLEISAYPKESETDMILGTIGVSFKF